jgi:competence protein ComEC
VPAQRAWWMLLVAALARLSRCQTGASTVLAWALGMVVLIDPWAVASPGFSLSFGAVAALVLASGQEPASAAASPRRETQTVDHAGARWGLGRSAPRMRLFLHACGMRLCALLRLHWAVTLALVPLSVAWFAQIPLLSVPANLLAIPWVSFFVTPAVLLGVALPAPLDALALRAAHLGLDQLAAYLDILAAPGWGLWRLPIPEPLPFGLALLGVLWWLAPRGWPLRHWAGCLWLPLLWPANSAPAPGEFRVTVLDVGQGGAALVETAHHRLLFDTGSGPSAGDAGARVVVPYLQGRGFAALDLLAISHGDSDHAGGALAVLQALRVSSLRASLPPAHRLWAQAQAAGVKDAAPCGAGQHWQWDGVTLAFLWPDSGADPGAPNQTACVLKVSNAAHAALLSADIEAAAEGALTARAAASEPAQLRADILLAPHHGSKTSSTPDFLAAIVPRHVVFQVGYRNRFHHPDARIVARYAARDALTYRSDRDGAVQFETSAQALEVQRYRVTHQRYWMGR